MLQVFYLDVVYVLQWFQVMFRYFASVSDLYFKCFIVFRRMLQLLYIDVSKLDRVLHLPPHLLLPRYGVRHRKQGQAEAVPTSAAGPHMHARVCSSMQHV
jgi:hypothetical protein